MPNCENCGAPPDFPGAPCAYCGPLPKVIKRTPKPHLTLNYIKTGTRLILMVIALSIVWSFYSKPETKTKQDKAPAVPAPSIAYVPVYAHNDIRPVPKPSVVQNRTPEPTPVVFENLGDDQKQVLLKKQLAELNFVESMRKQREEPEPVLEEPKPVREPVRRKEPEPANPNRLLVMGKIEALQKTIDKQERVVKAIASNSRPCSECGYSPIGTKSVQYPNSLKTETVWWCGNCGKTYANRTIETKWGQYGGGKQDIPVGSFLYTPCDSRDERLPSHREAAYRQQSLILEDLQKQLGILKKTLNGVPLLASDVPTPATPAEPKPKRFYVLQDREVEVVSEVETGQEIVVKTPKGEFVVIKRKDIKDVVTK